MFAVMFVRLHSCVVIVNKADGFLEVFEDNNWRMMMRQLHVSISSFFKLA